MFNHFGGKAYPVKYGARPETPTPQPVDPPQPTEEPTEETE